MLSRMSSNRRVKRDDHEPEEVDDESMGDSEEEAETEFFERNTNEFKCKKGQEQYVFVSKNHLIIKKYLLQKKISTLQMPSCSVVCRDGVSSGGARLVHMGWLALLLMGTLSTRR